MEYLLSLANKDNQICGNGIRIESILRNLGSLHISCQEDCIKTVATDNDFVGVALFAEDGDKIFEDNGKLGEIRMKSGYIFAVPVSGLVAKEEGGTYHKQTYEKLFNDIMKQDDVVMVGFSQQNGWLQGRSATCNRTSQTSLVTTKDNEAHFILRILVFGALLVNKISRERKGVPLQNVSPFAALMAVILFLVVRKSGTAEQKLRLPDLDIEWMDVIIEKMFNDQGPFAKPKPEMAMAMLLEDFGGDNFTAEKFNHSIDVLVA